MSTAANHKKRSRRGSYKKRPFNNGARQSVIRPTARKQDYFSWMMGMRRAFERNRKERRAEESE